MAGGDRDAGQSGEQTSRSSIGDQDQHGGLDMCLEAAADTPPGRQQQHYGLELTDMVGPQGEVHLLLRGGCTCPQCTLQLDYVAILIISWFCKGAPTCLARNSQNLR